jgi:hypothetical protein
MQSTRETFTLRFIFGPPVPNGKANGRIFSTFISTLLAYEPPYTNKCGAECCNNAIANLSEEQYTEALTDGSCSVEKE